MELAEFVTFTQTNDLFWIVLYTGTFVCCCLFAFLMYKYPMDGTRSKSYETKI